jgi:2-polyprenyl-3-methyl-5-hydroxy-6-metoxy-1,4-benzoquinol methylase
VYLDPPPNPVDLRIMYQDHKQFTSDHYTSPERVHDILEYMTTSLERVRGHQGVPGKTAVSILEIGAGRAWMCRAAKGLNPASRTVAQDISAEVVDQCPWVDRYHHGEVYDRALWWRGRYDVISITHVIEHLVDPVRIIKRCMALLANSGIVYITAPHRPLGWVDGNTDIEPWKGYSLTHVPAHVQYFSRESMDRLATRCGARLVYWNHEHEGGQAFEAWLAHAEGRPSTMDRALGAMRLGA